MKVEYDRGTMFPITRYQPSSPTQTGNNNYYAIERHPDDSLAGIVSGGQEDLLLYEEGSFSIKRMDPLLYHRDIEWVDGGAKAITAASRMPPDTGGVLMEYLRRNNKFRVLQKTSINILGLDRQNDSILAVGGQKHPTQTGVIYTYKEGELAVATTPNSAVLQTVAVSPAQQSKVLMAGERGTVMFKSGNDSPSIQSLPGKPFLKSIAWHPSGQFALIGGEQGHLYRWKNGEVTRVTVNLEWTIHDIAWHPSGNFALLVGGIGAGDVGYWAHYRNLEAESHQLSKPFFAVDWMDPHNALLGGQKVLWRFSTNRSPEDFGLDASLSVSHRRINPNRKMTLSGFGSTYHANADSVPHYLFKLSKNGDTSGWQSFPDLTVTYSKSGRYVPQLLVKGEDGNTISRDTAVVTVGNRSSSSQNTTLNIVMYLLGFALIVLFVFGIYFWATGWPNNNGE